MGEMVERVARAMLEHDPVVLGMLTPDELQELARAAIEAMKEPTQEMIERSWRPDIRNKTGEVIDAVFCYRAMIAAVKE